VFGSIKVVLLGKKRGCAYSDTSSELFVFSYRGLERNLVANSQHDNTVLNLAKIIVVDFGQTEVVTGVNDNVVKLVRQTKGNRDVNLLHTTGARHILSERKIRVPVMH